MQLRFFYLLFFILLTTSCNAQNANVATAEPIRINRFDKALYEVIQSNDPTLQDKILLEYPEMMGIIGKSIFNMPTITSGESMNRIINYYSEPNLNRLYREAIASYESIEDIENAMGEAFTFLNGIMPNIATPKVYMHVSGFNQNVLVGENLLSISIDKYLGKDYPLYKEFFYDYQCQRMERSQIVPDYLKGWLYSELPFEGKNNVLLDRMIYEGKIKYLIAQAAPKIEAHTLMGYTEQEYEWCQKNEKTIWQIIVEQKHLYTPDQSTTNKYFEEQPSSFISEDAPGNIGTWIGWQIINKYMKEGNSSIVSLIGNQNAQDILTNSKYKP